MIDVFIPSYKRAKQLRTLNYFVKIGWNPKNIHVVIDSEAEDKDEYDLEVVEKRGANLHLFDIEEARGKYDFVHRPSESRRAAGMARNMIYDIVDSLGIEFYIVQDDDTTGYQIKLKGKYQRQAVFEDLFNVFEMIKEFMLKREIGLFGISQCGDFIGGTNEKLLRHKVMNTTFVNREFMYRGERGVQDDDTSQFVGIMNEGLFTGSTADGLALQPYESAKQTGGLTDLYNECRLLNKALICPIQWPSCVIAERRKTNGGRIHHRINNKFLKPRLIKTDGIDNISWKTYTEDRPFSFERKT